MNQTCTLCKYFGITDLHGDGGGPLALCFRYPPVITSEVTEHGNFIQVRPMLTTNSMACGEFSGH